MVIKGLDSQAGVPSSKPLAGCKVDSAFRPTKVNHMSTRNFFELGKSELSLTESKYKSKINKPESALKCLGMA